MGTGFVFPERASTFAGNVDLLYVFLVAITVLFSFLIFSLVLVFAVKYRRRSDSERPAALVGNLRLEVFWIVVPLVIAMVTFVWGANLFFGMARAPAGAENIFVTGKQWMWIIQHPEGKREVNELHVPLGRPVKLTMISEDVIHDFFIPAFRVKRDVLPGRYSSMWFEPSKLGSYHLFCAEYCGTEHSLMIGKVVVMTPVDYENWLSGGASTLSLAERGQRLFARLGCLNCHGEQASARGPALTRLFGAQVSLQDGRRVVADEAYIRESILEPNAKRVAGFEPIMPTYRGQISEEQLLQLTAFIKSMREKEEAGESEKRP